MKNSTLKPNLKNVMTALFIALFFCNSVPAQVEIHLIKPEQTAAGIYTVHAPHHAMSPSSNYKNRLVINIPGTNAGAGSFNFFDSIAASEGFHAISLDYNNKVATPTFSRSRDPEAFDKFRQEVIFGTPVCDSVIIDSTNALYNRIVQLVKYLAINNAAENWSQFLQGETLDWKKIILAGHSQGAGAAAYLAHYFPVDKVILLAGPQDFRINFHSPANWTNFTSKTSRQRYYTLLHIKDPNNINNQLQCFYNITGLSKSDIVNINDLAPDRKKARLLVTNIPSKNPHSIVTTSVFKEVWKYMLKD